MSAPQTAVIRSLDPRITRLQIPEQLPEFQPKPPLDEWEPYEVFWKEKPGDQPIHVGTVHAPNAEMALAFAKENYCRRGRTAAIWVVRTADIFTFSPDDADMFATVPEKTYREPDAYKVAQKLLRFKRQHAAGESHGT